MTKERTLDSSQDGALSVRKERPAGVAAERWGRPVRESRTPVNMGNRPHCDNGEGVVTEPLPYPLFRRNARTAETRP